VIGFCEDAVVVNLWFLWK